ncbi:succinylglutamate-semialdehyde dehydrogenase [Planctomicrobium sp. SH664]|uniref:succinylglutamate-semialdehyde dehydrogenase n=1 Tax=Planctomicrobium sp. SH664 TaxID=3448125 RepID=UPI003F5AE211
MLLINGTWVEGGGEPFHSQEPVRNDVIWSGRAANAGDVERAVESARRALPDWSRKGIAQRTAFLHRFRSELKENSEQLTTLISCEVGKPLWDARTEVQAMIGKVDASLQALEQRRSPTEIAVPGGAGWTRYKPHGVVAVFGPFNFPGHIANGQIIPALAAGNTVLLKPSELTPLFAEEMVRCWERAGLPPGVLNLLQGARETGELIVDHPAVNGIFFTGSLQTGIALRRKLVEHPEKILALELGGNSPLVVHHVRDAAAAAYWTVQSAYVSAGQRCTCARRLIVTDGNDEFLRQLTAMIQGLKIGLPDAEPQPFFGPLIHAKAAQQMLDEQRRLIESGGVAIVPAQPLSLGPAFVSPGLIDVTDCRAIVDEEVFGPLLQLYRVRDLQEAIQVANQTRYGLVASLLCDDRADFETFFDEVQAGLINWNRPTTGASGLLPFGGVGKSGNHRPAGSFTVDFCNVPVASLTSPALALPDELTPGVPSP